MFQATPSSASATLWTQPKGTARTFRASSAGVLRVTTGRAWATLNPTPWSPQPRWCPHIDAGDLFLGPDTAGLSLRAGQSVVLESWPADMDRATAFAWQATAPSAQARRWQQAVAQPARELGLGLLQAARAMARLAWGLASYPVGLLAALRRAQQPGAHCSAS